ncbi:MAG: RNA polymerase sigma factor [Phycisphaerae bacterium]|nr:RNA polymerase sigma factor [Phycisphaerae bacterium]
MPDTIAQLDVESADREDVRRSLAGDGDAYARIMRRHQQHVARVLWRFTRDENLHAELVQDVFVQAYWGLGRYAGTAPLEHWLARIAVRTGYRFWRRRREAAQPIRDEVPPTDRRPGPAAEAEAAEAAERVQRLLAQLPPRDRLVLTLMYLDGCDVREAARLTGWSVAMVKVQAWRARAKLKKLLESA